MVLNDLPHRISKEAPLGIAIRSGHDTIVGMAATEQLIDPGATFSRGQMESAIWNLMTQGKCAPPKITSQFKARTKKLLDVDHLRKAEKSSQARRYAFNNYNSGKGTDAAYSYKDALALWFGLELTDAGHKQSEVVFLTRHVRSVLDSIFDRIIKTPYFNRGAASIKEFTDLPVYADKKGFKNADPHVFMVINKVEFKELYGIQDKRKNSDPLIFEPKIILGVNELGHFLWQEVCSQHKFLIIELSEAAHNLSLLLAKTPAIKRGRK